MTAISTCIGSGNEEYDERGDHQYCGTNYWAGAKKACDEFEMRLPTMQELGDIATYIYEQEDNPLGATGYINTTPNAGRAASLSWNTSG